MRGPNGGGGRLKEHDVVGIGNAIGRQSSRCGDAFLARFGRVKGSMQLVDAARSARLYVPWA